MPYFSGWSSKARCSCESLLFNASSWLLCRWASSLWPGTVTLDTANFRPPPRHFITRWQHSLSFAQEPPQLPLLQSSARHLRCHSSRLPAASNQRLSSPVLIESLVHTGWCSLQAHAGLIRSVWASEHCRPCSWQSWAVPGGRLTVDAIPISLVIKHLLWCLQILEFQSTLFLNVLPAKKSGKRKMLKGSPLWGERTIVINSDGSRFCSASESLIAWNNSSGNIPVTPDILAAIWSVLSIYVNKFGLIS